MTKRRDYDTEVLKALAEKPANGFSLQRILHIAPKRVYGILKALEEDGKIRWLSTSEIDGVWELKI